jgi:intracellular sulfur oxidation DsrE/DsrF family protein
MKKSIYLSICLILSSTMAFAAQFNNEKALKGLSSVKIVCDVNVGDPDLLLTRMYFLDTTYSQLLDFGVKPIIVVAFRGKASLFITKNDKYIKAEHRKQRLEMKDWLEHFSELGFTIEQCYIAAKSYKIDTKDFLPQVNIVANGYISLIGYQSQGYAFLPMD